MVKYHSSTNSISELHVDKTTPSQRSEMVCNQLLRLLSFQYLLYLCDVFQTEFVEPESEMNGKSSSDMSEEDICHIRDKLLNGLNDV
jgi:hypothetical protein